MRMKEYTGSKRNEISFPLGGIGSGCIGFGGDGRFVEWEVFNKPNKGGMNGFSHMALKAERGGKVLDARVLHTDLKPPFSGERTTKMFSGFGHGPYRETMTGVPHFRDGIFRAAYPFAELTLTDGVFPGRVQITAFNPLIPLQADDSSIPAAFFEVCVENTTSDAIDYTAAFSLSSPFGRQESALTDSAEKDRRCLLIRSTDKDENDLAYGEMCVATDAEDTAVQQYWFRGRWYDDLSVFWQNFCTPGHLKNRVYDHVAPSVDQNGHDTGTLEARFTVPAGQEKTVRFVVSWYFPNCSYYLDPSRETEKGEKQWKNYYAKLYAGAQDAALDALNRWQALKDQSVLFAEAFFSQSLDEPILDAISANISILKSPTVLRLADGSFYGWEGTHCHAGSCDGSCTHVWNYAYALPFLFPQLERSMHELNYRYNQDKYGGMHFRLQLPLGAPQSTFRPCCDGQFGGIVLIYREWKLCGDDEWLKALWPAVRKSMEYAWSPNNEDQWDLNRDGVLEGRQHHTLDMELFGPNAWLTSMYLAALKAAAEMAEYLGDHECARQYNALFENGSRYVDKELFSGEYYSQKIDLNDQSLLMPYMNGVRSLQDDSVLDAYWNEEAGEIKYQIGTGCGIDQVLGQWHATMCGLGEILDPAHVKSALEAIYRHNHKRDMQKYFNPCRIYYMPDERATVICDWPEGTHKPVIPAPYAEECFSGMEYQVASHMLANGMRKEALDIVSAVRDRYDGERRNPWNEIECGSNYSRSMASYALLLAASGFRFDLPHGMIGFVPADQKENQRFFWSVNQAWGVYEQSGAQRMLCVLAGSLTLHRFVSDRPIARVLLADKPVHATFEGNDAFFISPLQLSAGDVITLT